MTTVLVCIVSLAVLLACGRLARLSPAVPWQHTGSSSPAAWVLAIGTVLLAGLALVLWTLSVDPVAPPYLQTLQSAPVPLAVAGNTFFALVNSI